MRSKRCYAIPRKNEELSMSNEFGTVDAPGTVRIERLLPGSTQRVWSYLTDSQKRGKWLATGEMDLRPGGRVELRFKHSDLSPHIEPIPERYERMENGHTMHGRITRLDAPRLLSYTWGDKPGDSEVTFELSERGANVLLVVTHRRLDGSGEMASVAGGWHTHLDILVDNLHERVPRPFWSSHAKVASEYEKRMADLPGTVRVSRHFDASAERVFDAWLDPQIASQWLYTAPGGRMVRAEVDARVGGRYVFVDRRDGDDIEHHGAYLELDRPRRLVFTLCVPKYSEQEDRIAVDIVSTDAGCNLVITHEVSPQWAADTKSGWAMLLDKMATLVEQQLS
jgi:uncharacterized protein YndB with AHSA1/START domain